MTRRPTVHGTDVDEFAALVSPAAFLITRDGGTHEITRAYFQGGKYTVAHSTDRLGEFRLEHANLEPERLELTFVGRSGTFRVLIPGSRVQATFGV